MYLEGENIDYNLLRDAVCDSSIDTGSSRQTSQVNCPLKSCRSCNAAAAHHAATDAQINNDNKYCDQGGQNYAERYFRFCHFEQCKSYLNICLLSL